MDNFASKYDISRGSKTIIRLHKGSAHSCKFRTITNCLLVPIFVEGPEVEVAAVDYARGIVHPVGLACVRLIR